MESWELGLLRVLGTSHWEGGGGDDRLVTDNTSWLIEAAGSSHHRDIIYPCGCQFLPQKYSSSAIPCLQFLRIAASKYIKEVYFGVAYSGLLKSYFWVV